MRKERTLRDDVPKGAIDAGAKRKRAQRSPHRLSPRNQTRRIDHGSVHVGRLRKALSRGRERDPIRTVRGTGYAFDETFGKT